tara:strand:- start:918 stop:1451 length:534 start_codon:yes stop_codon:yes gene_type:complete
MARCIVYTRADGHITVVNLAWGSGPRLFGKTDDEFLDYVIQHDVLARPDGQGPADGQTYYVMEDTAVPTELRYFREAWECPNGVIKVNMPKARVIHMDRIRKKRNEELQKLDIPFTIAVERNDKTMMEKITVQKQKLRDIPQKYDLSSFKTPEELKAFWPKELEELDEKIKEVKKGL